MSFKVTATASKEFGEIPPAGTHPAILVGLVDLGTQEVAYQQKISHVRKVLLLWELTTEKMSGFKDRNFIVQRDYTMTFSEKSSLRGLMEEWRGKAFSANDEIDLAVMVGKPCFVSIIHETKGDRTFSKIKSVGQVPKGMTVAPAQTKPFSWELGNGPIPDVLKDPWMPYIFGESIEDVINHCDEWKGKKGQGAGNGNGNKQGEYQTPDDSTPF